MNNPALLTKYLIELRDEVDDIIEMLQTSGSSIAQDGNVMSLASSIETNLASIKEKIVPGV